MELLLKYGADPNKFSPSNEAYSSRSEIRLFPPLFHAISAQKKEKIDLLLKYGADWESIVPYGARKVKLKKYPFYRESTDTIKFIRSRGWKGSLFK